MLPSSNWVIPSDNCWVPSLASANPSDIVPIEEKIVSAYVFVTEAETSALIFAIAESSIFDAT